MDDFIERIRDANPIEDVVPKLGFKFERERGASRRVAHTGGLVVNTRTQRYFWASKGWNGDVFDLVMRYQEMEFTEAVDWLADMGKVERPNWGKVDHEAIKAARAKEGVFDVAQRVFERWLQEDAQALAYVQGRGLTDETIAEARIGFSGRGGEAFYQDLRGEFSLYGVDPTSPAAVAMLGYRGELPAWAQKYGVNAADLDDNWIQRGYISGLISVPGIVYAHYVSRRLVYFSRRQLPGYDKIKGEDGQEREWKSWNPPKVLVGERQFFFNHAWRAEAQECLIVEGQMDAITLAQWGMPAVALCGLGSSPDAMNWLIGKLNKHLVRYLALDADEAGQEKVRKLGAELGPMTRIVRWPEHHGSRGQAPSEDDDQGGDEPKDALFEKALEIGQAALDEGKKVTISLLQRSLRIGYMRATRLQEQVMEELGETPALEGGSDEIA